MEITAKNAWKWIATFIIIPIVTGVIVNIINDKFKVEKPFVAPISKDTNIPQQPNVTEIYRYYEKSIPSSSSDVAPNQPDNQTYNNELTPETRENQANTLPQVSKCQLNNTGTYIFKNNTRHSLEVIVSISTYNSIRLTLPPGAEKNTGDLPVGSLTYEIKNQDIRDETGNYSVGDYGKIQIEQCNTGRYDINIIKLPEKEYDPNRPVYVP